MILGQLETADVPERVLLADGAVYAMVEIVQQSLGFIALPVFLFFLSAQDFGAVTWGITVAQLSTGLATLGLEWSVLRLYWRWPESERASILSRVGTISLLWSLAAGAAASFGVWWLGATAVRVPVVLGVWAGAALGVRSIALSVFRVRGPIRRYARLVLVGAGLQTGVGLLLVWLGWKATGYLTGYALGAIVTAAFAVRDLRPWRQWRPGGLRLPIDVLTYTLHTFPANMINRTIGVADRLVLGSVGGIDTFGLYGAATRFTTPVRFMASSFRMALGPSMSKTESKGDLDAVFGRLAFLVTALMLLTGSLVAVAVWFVRLTPWAPDQGQLQRIALILLVSEFLSAMTSLGQLRLYYSPTPRDASLAVTGGAVVLLVLLVLLVPRFGSEGAAAAKILAGATGFMAVVALGLRRRGVAYRWTGLGALVGSFAPALIATYLFGATGQILVFSAMSLAYGAVACLAAAPLWQPRRLAISGR